MNQITSERPILIPTKIHGNINIISFYKVLFLLFKNTEHGDKKGYYLRDIGGFFFKTEDHLLKDISLRDSQSRLDLFRLRNRAQNKFDDKAYDLGYNRLSLIPIDMILAIIKEIAMELTSPNDKKV